MKQIQKSICSIVTAIALLALSTPVFASSLPVGVSQFYLAGAGVTSSGNAVQLTSFTTPDGRPITMTMFGTVGYGAIDPQTTSKIEDITFSGIVQNANGTATLTGVTRGNDFVFPYSATPSLGHSHSGGATFIITNTAGFYYNEFSMQNNSNVFTWPSASSSPATKGYVDSVAFGNVPSASTIAQGVVQLATGLQAASSTGTGSAGSLVIPASLATSTYNAQTAALRVVVTNNAGTIDPNFISGFGTTTTIGAFPAYQVALQRQIFSSPGTSSFIIPAGITKLRIQTIGAGGGGGGPASTGGGGGGGGGYADKTVDVTGTTSVQVFVGTGGAGGSSAAGSNGTWSTFGTNGFYMSGAGGLAGQIAGNFNGGLGGAGTSGDFNISGGQGQGGSSGSTIPAGIGGSTPLGFGGGSPGLGGGIGSVGTGFGGGGGGGFGNAGGAGANGGVIISW